MSGLHKTVPVALLLAAVTTTSASTAAPRPDPVASPNGLSGMAPIASEFDIMTRLQKSWGHGRPAKSSGKDPVGAFRMLCGAGVVKDVDNIVAFGRRSPHTHQIAGNEGTTPTSTYRDLRTSGSSSCGNEANRTNYWMPVLLNGRGQIVQPDYLLLYYKRRPLSDPKCQGFNDALRAQGRCVPLPNGLRMIAGYDFATGKSSGLHFSCSGGPDRKTKRNLEDLQAACPADKPFVATVVFPSCWDGKNLDSPDHRSHMAYPGYGSRGWSKCPSSHPYVIPRLEQKYRYSQAPGEIYSYASDAQVPGIKRGATGHGDFFEAWDPVAKRMFEEHCLNQRLNCSGGDLGNGWQIKNAARPRYGWKNPKRLVGAGDAARQGSHHAGHAH